MQSRSDHAEQRRNDRAVQHLARDRWIVTVAALVWIAGTLFGTGRIGGGVAQQVDGLFSDAATLIAPDGPAFSIWSVIYLGLAGYVVWQWLPASSRSAWTRLSRLPAAASIALLAILMFLRRTGRPTGGEAF